LLTSS
jgi:ATP-binding cassette subfamily C (CFTR/MRP) protein 1